jgi:hypothetical protein
MAGAEGRRVIVEKTTGRGAPFLYGMVERASKRQGESLAGQAIARAKNRG